MKPNQQPVPTAVVIKKVDQSDWLLLDSMGQLIEPARAFLASLETRCLSALTVRAYAYDLLALYRWLTVVPKAVIDLQQADLLEFISYERSQGVGAKSINRRLTTIRSYYQFCTGRKLDQLGGVTLPAAYYKGAGRDRQLGLFVLKKPAHRLLRVKEAHKVIDPLEAEQVRLFLRTLKRYRDISIVYLMLLCGLRSREVLSTELPDLSFEQQLVRVHGKGQRERMLPLPELLLKVLQKYLQLERPRHCRHDTVFVVLQGCRAGEPMTPDGLRSLFRHRRQTPALMNANPHRLRHTFGADMARHGVRLTTLQRMLGHASPVMTLHYINLSMNEIADELRRATEQIQQRYQASV